MTSEYIPSNDRVRVAYIDASFGSEFEAQEEFDRWLDLVRAEAWARGNQAGWCEGYSHSDPEPNPYL